MFRLIHISDVHLTPMPKPKFLQLFNKRITGWINWKLNRKQEIVSQTLEKLVYAIQKQPHDHLVITGDLVNLALPVEFENAYHWLKKVGSVKDVSLVFGNHDAYVPGALKLATKICAPWISSDVPIHDAFPYIRIRDNIAIIGCSSALATMPFRATGTFGEKQAKALAKLLKFAEEKELFRVVMIHHPPVDNATHRHKILTDINCFQAVIEKNGADLILHGHTHLPTLYYIKGREKNVPVVGVASASQSFGGKKPPANYNLFEIEKHNGKWQNTLLRYAIVDEYDNIACSETICFEDLNTK